MYAHVLVKRNSRRRRHIDGSVAFNASGIRVKECCFGGASLKKIQYLWNDAEVVTNPMATQAKESVSPFGGS